MKAIAVVPGKRRVQCVDHDEPAIRAPTEVKIRMRDIGVCGTDREICAFEYGTPPEGADHLILGHESLGQIVQTGPGVERLKPGDWVVPMVRRPCLHEYCAACRAGRQDFCCTGDFREHGIKELHGFMTEMIVDDERFVHRVPAELHDVAVLVEPLTIAEKALAQVWQVQQRLPWACPIVPGKAPGHCRRAVILGAGPVGLLGMMAFVAADFDTYVYSRDPKDGVKAEIVRSVGATFIAAEEYTPATLGERLGNIDVVYEAAGASRVSFELLKSLGVNGVFIFTGVPGRKGPIELDADLIMRNLVLKNQVVYGTVNAGREAFEAAIRDLALFQYRWPAAVRSLITNRFPMDSYRELLLGTPGGIKNVIHIT